MHALLYPWQQGMTAVHIAAKRSNVAALKLLLDFSGNPNATCEVYTYVHVYNVIYILGNDCDLYCSSKN